jgi:small-conductance mechanosensitive channel
VCEIAVNAAASVERVLVQPSPVCHLKAFCDSSLNFILRFWIRDPVDGLTNVRGKVLLALWDTFKREGIEIPYPVRDVRIRQAAAVAASSKRNRPARR